MPLRVISGQGHAHFSHLEYLGEHSIINVDHTQNVICEGTVNIL